MPPLTYPHYTPKRITNVSTQILTLTTLVNLTEFVLQLEANAKYIVNCFIIWQTSSVTSGPSFGFVTPTGSKFLCDIETPTSTSTTTSSMTGMTFPNSATLSNSSTSAQAYSTINNNATTAINGVLVTDSNIGAFQLTAAAKVAATPLTIQLGSELIIQRFA